MAALQRRERRLLIVAVIVAAGVLGYLYVVEPLVERHRNVRALVESREELLARQQRLVARRDRYAEERAALDAEIAQGRARLLPGNRAPLAASELQKVMKSTAEDTGVEVRSERVLPTTERGGYTEVPVEVTLSGPIRAIVSFLHRLEAAPVLLGVNDLKLRVISIGSPRELSATVALTGYILSSAEAEQRPGRPEPGRRPGA